MEDKITTKNIEGLAIAALLSEGEFDIYSNNVIKAPFDPKKTMYLLDYVKENRLEKYIDINQKRAQFTIHSHISLARIKKQWYNEVRKIFSLILDPQLLSRHSILMSINLFGIRKKESITITTTVDKDHIKAVAYCIEKQLGVTVIPTATGFKITNVPKFIIMFVNQMPAIHSAELINFLTEQEKKKLMEGALS